ncbi:PfkB family carbohydrate kinase [Bifidobacterium oedipodis]|uniref:Kinase, PfkB family n=1 Tax=Bifidobacterium oedipodis TaxID=2675322 RepID=A0A7Y0ERK1_9BIFI|nr:PfkB family carbohydrate kinase [Bifidobacterium sp. DSM 109957]NMM95129.1 Kinase, PfkB family [Bifidobacterium sp. DSM 109957]
MGTVISLGQIIVDVTMQVSRVPSPGEDLFADGTAMRVGASYNTLHAARCMGAQAVHGGIIGTGPWGRMVADALAADGIRHDGPIDQLRDTGFCVALTDQAAERTFISTRGAEAAGGVHTFDGIHPRSGDVVHISGYTLVHHTADGLSAFLERTSPSNRAFTAVFDPSPVIGQVDNERFAQLVAYRPIWSCNGREAGLLAARLGMGESVDMGELPNGIGNGDTADAAANVVNADDAIGAGAGAAVNSGDVVNAADAIDVAADAAVNAVNSGDTVNTINAVSVTRLATLLGAPLIVRVGAAGAWVVDEPGRPAALVAGFPVQAVDTNGAGDCHTGVLCAELASGRSLREAVLLANAAASISVTKHGPATCPTRAEAEALCANHFSI